MNPDDSADAERDGSGGGNRNGDDERHSTAALRSSFSHTPAPRTPAVAASPKTAAPRARTPLSARMGQIVGPLAAVLALTWMLRTEWALIRVLRELFAGDGPTGQVVRIFSFRNTADGPLIDGFGLTFVGWGGVGLAALQMAVLLAAVVAAFMPAPSRQRLRSTLMLGGVAVGLMWTGSLIWLLIWSFDVFSLVFTLGHVLGLLAMILAMRWRLRVA